MLDTEIKKAITECDSLEKLIERFSSVDRAVIIHHVKQQKPEWLSEEEVSLLNTENIQSESLSHTSSDNLSSVVAEWAMQNPLASTKELYAAFPGRSEGVLRNYRCVGRDQFLYSFIPVFSQEYSEEWERQEAGKDDFTAFIRHIVTYPSISKQNLVKKYNQYKGEFLTEWKNRIIRAVNKYLEHYVKEKGVLDHAASLNIKHLADDAGKKKSDVVRQAKSIVVESKTSEKKQADLDDLFVRMEQLEVSQNELCQAVESVERQIKEKVQIVLSKIESLSSDTISVDRNQKPRQSSGDGLQQALLQFLLQQNTSELDAVSLIQKVINGLGAFSITFGGQDK